jgi:DNA polymerase III epsilon subunit-like protein
MTPICFVDTETTSLRHDRRAWEVAVIVRRPGQPDHEQSWFIHEHELDLGNADLGSLKIGRFHDRHPQAAPGADQSPGSPLRTKVKPEFDVMRQVEELTRGAHLVGAVPNFDAEVLGNRMRAHGICPSWHYHLIDVETLAVGFLRSSAAYGGSGAGSMRELAGSITALPWNSEALSRALGVDPEDFGRHTALGDARWARAIFDVITARDPA